METNEIMNNEEIVETVEEIMTETSGNSLLVVGGVVAAVGASYVLVKKVVIPGYKKLKTKLEEKKAEQDDEVEE